MSNNRLGLFLKNAVCLYIWHANSFYEQKMRRAFVIAKRSHAIEFWNICMAVVRCYWEMWHVQFPCVPSDTKVCCSCANSAEDKVMFFLLCELLHNLCWWMRIAAKQKSLPDGFAQSRLQKFRASVSTCGFCACQGRLNFATHRHAFGVCIKNRSQTDGVKHCPRNLSLCVLIFQRLSRSRIHLRCMCESKC